MSAKRPPNRRSASQSKLSKKADFQTEAEFQRLRPGARGGDGLVKQQLISKLGPGAFGRLKQKLDLMAFQNADKTPAGD